MHQEIESSNTYDIAKCSNAEELSKFMAHVKYFLYHRTSVAGQCAFVAI
jgi:hypothetical protein